MTDNVNIRWMIRRDIPQVLEVEKACYTDPWDRQTFIHCLGQRKVVAMVVEAGGTVVGYMIYENYRHHMRLNALAVHPDWQKIGIGTLMVARLKEKLTPHRRNQIKMTVSEHCDTAHLFLRSLGFKAVEVERNFFKVGDRYEDAYQFVYDYNRPYRHEQGSCKARIHETHSSRSQSGDGQCLESPIPQHP